MSNTFVFVGKINRKKDGAFNVRTFDSGWMINELNLSMVCGDNVQFLRASGGMWDDAHSSKNEVMTFKHVENGKDEAIRVKWNDRDNSDVVSMIANYRTWTVDTETYEDRKIAEDSGDTEAIETSKKKHKTFITAIDFVRWLDKVTSNEKTKDWIWRVTGDVEYSYSKGRWYRNFVPRRVYHVNSETAPQCVGTIKTFYSAGCMDETDDIYLFNVYTQYYDQMLKKNCFTPIMLEISKENSKAKGFKTLYNKVEDSQVKELGINVNYINGAQKTEITEDMLCDEQRELLSMGLITFDDIRKELGDSVYGERKTAIELDKPAYGYSKGPKETVYEVGDLTKLPIKEEVESPSDDIDIFSSNDDDEI